MTVKQFPALGLILALFFGARTANRSESLEPALRASSTVKESRASNKTKASAHPAKPAVAATDDDCNETLATKLQQRWWMSRSSHGCSLTMAPVWREICKINPTHEGGEKSFADAQDAGGFSKLCVADPAVVQSMMAAVPNPRHTHLGLMTDRAIEAIQVAASEAHFLPLAHYLPWPSPSAGANGSEGSDEELQFDPSDPGVLIFQDALRPLGLMRRPTYLLVFLIPETPTEGLDRVVFSKAGGIIKRISPSQDDVLRFVGPNFSGSVAGLEDLQKTLADPSGQTGPAIRAVSGSVTNAANIAKPSVKFNATQTSDRVALCLFIQGAEQFFGYDRNEIAILSEEGTQYGRQGPEDQGSETGSTASGTAKAIPGKAGEDPARKSQGNCESPKRDALAGLWFLHFPREISKLRNAYGAEVGKSAPADPNSSPDLGLQWQDSESSQRDDLQTYGDRQTPLSQEAVLSSLSITLKAQGIKALGILATDPMDEAFLIHSIKRSSPDVRLFLRDPDLLFLRTPDVGSLNGTLLVSNYPLVPENQFWSSNVIQKDPAKPGEKDDTLSSADQHLITFPSAFQEGEYNAFVQLLIEAKWAASDMQRLEWDWPAGMAASQQDSASTLQPGPLWLATIGTAGHYPIQILNNDPQKASAMKLHSLNLGPPQFVPIAFWASIAIVGVLHLAGLKLPSAVPSMFKHDFDLSNKASTVTLVKLLCHQMALLTIALAQFVLGSSYLFFFRSRWGYTSKSQWSYPALACLVIVVTLLLLWTTWELVREIFVLGRQQQRLTAKDDASEIMSPGRIMRSSLICGSILLIAGVSWAWLTAGNRFENAFLHFRDLNLSSGVAPTLPLASVLLVLYFGIWGYLRRLSYWEHRYVEVFQLKIDPVIHQEFGDDIKAIDTCLLGPLENWKWLMGMGLAFGLSFLAFRPWDALDMIEPSRVSNFAVVFFAFALLSLWLNWFRFLNVWVHLRNILERMENLPIRTAFQRLPKEKSLPILQWSSSQNIFLLRQVLDRLRALALADPTGVNVRLEADFEKRIDAVTSHGVVPMQYREQRVVGGSPWRGPMPMPSMRLADHLQQARQEMTRTTKMLSMQLRKKFWNRGSSSTQQDQKVRPADLKYLLAEDIVALPFYAYIRKVISEMRNILFFLGIAISLLFAALHTYAFRADQAIDWWFFGLSISMGLGIVFVIAQMERNALISRLSDRTPGELGSNFYLQLLKYGMVPILTIFGSQVPSISNIVLKWVQPAVEALH